MSRPRARAWLACCAAALLTAVAARAERPWSEHYTRGLALESQGAWAQALLEFQAAARIAPVPENSIRAEDGTTIDEYDPHYHIALCLTELGRPRLAAEQLRRSANAHVTPPAKIQALRKRIQGEIGGRAGGRGEVAAPEPTAAPTTGQLTVDSDPSGATVSIDGAAAGTTPLGPVELAQGAHAVRVEARGFRPVDERVTVTVGETATLVVPLAAVPAATPARASKPQAARPTVPAPTAVPAAAAPAPTAAAFPTSPLPATTAAPAGRQRHPLAGLAVLLLLALAGATGLGVWLRRRRGAATDLAETTHTVEQERPTILVETGTKLGAFDLHGVLGRGGMATTYRARRGSDGQTVAIKVPHEGCLSDQTFVTRFLREGKLGEQLHHPRIVRILSTGEDRGRPYLAMELVEGRTLKQEIREHAPFALKRALEITRDIAEALDYAHAKGVVHRDLKPENVMLLPDGTVKVMDFGIARLADQPGLTTSNIFLGTPLYAAPEMVDPKNVDHRADLYALGIILYELLEGGVPFTADSPYRVLEMHMRQPLPAREALPHPVPEPVWAIVQKLCEKDPAARYQHAEALLVELNRMLQNLPVSGAGDVF
ncbi:MAG TPA: protein kinase [Thermoanaerobaculaceae bacterium]|nr:protein kinase [Thermoanaerobaculaceae bacterium]